MQTNTLIEPIGWLLVFSGIILIFVGLILTFRGGGEGPTTSKTESKGIILIGPIPIVWGFGKKTWLISAIGVVLILLFIVFYILL
ncbi:MAG: DUF131 domain-containing protein [Promethearchaeota archaeon]